MRVLVVGLLALALTCLFTDAAYAPSCPNGYVPCGQGLCCPR